MGAKVPIASATDASQWARIWRTPQSFSKPTVARLRHEEAIPSKLSAMHSHVSPRSLTCLNTYFSHPSRYIVQAWQAQTTDPYTVPPKVVKDKE